jgi:hypothetical protein
MKFMEDVPFLNTKEKDNIFHDNAAIFFNINKLLLQQRFWGNSC